VKLPHISVCVCTYKRPDLLKHLLEEVAAQSFDGSFEYSIVVADNDAERSAERVVAGFVGQHSVPTIYCCEPTQNIALVRNKAIKHAHGDFIAFLDDDEFPAPEWLQCLFQTCQQRSVAGVLGPVRPHFEQTPPGWITKGRFCERPEHPTGTVMDPRECRTGNVLFRAGILQKGAVPFDERFGNGGEDVDFFVRMSRKGHEFLWCNEAVAYETVPPARMKRSYMLRRALLRGRNSLKISQGRVVLILKSVVAVPLYSLVLPAAFLLGQHRFMNYCIRLCDHLGRVLALVGLNRIQERDVQAP
jgi:glycosyltransferase involved in cell wall biosynthesis